MSTRKTTTLRLRVSATAESLVRGGHPWIFGDSVREQNRDGTSGEVAVIFDRNDKFLAIGLFDPDSPIRVRVLHAGKPTTIDATWWATRLAQAIEKRRDIFTGNHSSLPSPRSEARGKGQGEGNLSNTEVVSEEHLLSPALSSASRKRGSSEFASGSAQSHGLIDGCTNGYRVINGESDGWPGLVLDRYDTTLVLKLYTAIWLPRLEEIAGLILVQLRPERLVLRLSRNIQKVAEAQFKKTDGEILFGPPLDGSVIFSENGVRFDADVLRGQKTGFFLDQRENRRLVESLARGRNVLNAFSFSGGFSLYAGRGGASSVTDLDISAHALSSANRNFALNQSDSSIARCRHESVQADTFDWLRDNPQRKFDLIILDPPSFAKREAERANAIRAYERLAALGIEHLARGGILVACSCSAHVSADEFFNAIRRAGHASGRRFEELQTTGHAPDHPAAFREAEYLKGIYLKF